jgi:hypothetical protein
MDPHNPIGAPYDPDPDDALPDNQKPLTDDYVDDAVDDVERDLYDNPEDVPAEDREQLREGVLDTMPGDMDDAHRDLQSPNSPRNRADDPRAYDSDRNPDLDAAVGKRTSDEVLSEEEMLGDVSEDDPRVERRIG